MKHLLTILISYLIGSFSTSFFLGKKMKGIDIRDYGSGNAGATNTLRVLGKKAAIMTFISDFIKGIIATKIGFYISGYYGGLLASIFVVLGHNYSLFLSFKGGKGIATSLGILYVLNWKVGILCTGIGLITVILTRYVSLGSIFGAISAPVILYLLDNNIDRYMLMSVSFLAVLAVVRHRTNIERLLKGRENKI